MESDTFDGTLPTTVDTEAEDAGGGAGSDGRELSTEHPMDTTATTIMGRRLCFDIY
jgi:hypothetical protein